jgi:hypothetical protein
VASRSGRGWSSWTPGALNINTLRASVGPRAALLGTLALAIAVLWIRPADALPSFSGQTGLPCSACHVGGFGPQLTPFGISFRANGYTQGGGTGSWSHIPVDLLIVPSVNTIATSLPAAPPGYGTNDFASLECCAFYIAGGYSFDGNFGIGGLEQVSITAFVPGVPLSASEATSDFKLTKSFTLGTHSLLLGLDFTNTPTGGDPYNTLYDGYQFPYTGPVISVLPSASPAISVLGTSVYGLSLYAFYDNSIYAEAGLYESWSPGYLSAMNVSPSSLGTIYGGAPYFRLADQHSWGNNFLEIGGLFMDVPLEQIPGIVNQSAENEYIDWGLDATYQRTFGAGTLDIITNILFEQQNLGASFAAGTSANAANWLDQFRIAASYYWNNTYGFTLAYAATSGSTDPILYAPAPLTGSATGSPNSQAIIAQIDWTPWGNDTTHPGFPWLNVRVGLQYTYYLQFNGGTTNYDGFGRNASDNNTLLLFTWWAF